MKVHFVLKLFFICFFSSTLLIAQIDKPKDIWQPLKIFIGEWKGTSNGQSGNGKVEREYRSVMNGKYIEVKNKSTYEPQEINPEGEIHEDWGIISYDRTGKKFVLRQFHIEGFVNQYAQDSISPDGKTIIFVSESIENIPPGWRAKETYRIINENEITETFELAAPEKDFDVYSQSHLKRNKEVYESIEQFDPKRDAQKDIDDAIAEAIKSNQRIILDVGGNWCIWCKRLDTLFMKNKDLYEFMHKNFVIVKVNFSKENENEKVLSQYPEIKGYPHMFVLEKDGKLLHSQDTGLLESGKGHSREKVFEFLKKWTAR